MPSTQSKQKHKIKELCNCPYCVMLDVMFGDPLLNDWEKEFVESMCFQGGQTDYTPKQKAVIRRTFNNQRAKYRQKSL